MGAIEVLYIIIIMIIIIIIVIIITIVIKLSWESSGWDDQQSIFLPWFSKLSWGIEDANLTSKMPLFLLLQTLTNALLQTIVTSMLHVTTPKDLITASVRMDLKAMGD